MNLNRADIKELNIILEENPEIDAFELLQKSQSGIGYTLELIHTKIINNRPTKISMEVVGVENW